MPNFRTPSPRLQDFHPFHRLRFVRSPSATAPESLAHAVSGSPVIAGRSSSPTPRTPFVSLDSFQCLHAVFPLADLFHQSCSFSQAFRHALRHQRFGPFHVGHRRTPLLPLRRKGQHPLFGPVFLPLSAHKSRCLLALSFIPLAGWRVFAPGGGGGGGNLRILSPSRGKRASASFCHTIKNESLPPHHVL